LTVGDKVTVNGRVQVQCGMEGILTLATKAEVRDGCRTALRERLDVMKLELVGRPAAAPVRADEGTRPSSRRHTSRRTSTAM
jgi:hypothetical protein